MIQAGHPLVMFLEAFVTQAAGYFVVTGLVFAVVWRLGEVRFRAARIQAKKRFTRQQLVFEIRHTVTTLAFGTATAVIVSSLYAAGHTKLSTTPSDFTPLGLVGTFVGLLLFNDAWFYAWHRLLHHPALFRYVHAVHHKSVDVNPFSSYSFHPVEALILGGWVIPMVLLVPMYVPVLGALQAVGLANNVMSHLGYEFFPRWFIRVPPFRWLNTATFHSLHHTSLNGNFGLQFRWWDRLFGTEVPGYEATFVQRGAALDATTEQPPTSSTVTSRHAIGPPGRSP